MKTHRNFAFILMLAYSCNNVQESSEPIVKRNTNVSQNRFELVKNLPKKEDLIEKWFVYDKPINGYDVKIHWLCDKTCGYYGTGYFYFSNDSTTKILTHSIDIDGWFDKTGLMGTPDTIVLNQYYDESLQPYLDWRTIVGFADYNFDDKKDLVICETPRPYIGFAPDYCLDCETFVFYSDYPEGFVQINNVPFYRLSTETCRTCCSFDTIDKTLLLLSHGGACCYTSETYCFEDGRPYEVIKIVHEERVDRVIDDTIYHYYDYCW